MTAGIRQFDVIVLGAGAAGMMCAATAGLRGRRVALLDHNGQPGRKILVSGGGRCNFTNLFTEPQSYLSENPHYAKSALALFLPRHFIELVERYGIPWHEKTLGQLFCNGSARAIVDMLLAECDKGSVEIVLNAHEIEVEGACGSFRVKSSAGEFTSDALVVATGGKSIPKLGATGLGYELARQFGLKVVAPRPALVPLVLGGAEAGWTELAGVSMEVVAWAEAAAKRHPSGEKLAAVKGLFLSETPEKHPSGPKGHVDATALAARLKPCPFKTAGFSAACKAPIENADSRYGLTPVPFREKMLVTHRGLSGPAILQASLYWRPGDALDVNFLPQILSQPSDKNENTARVGLPKGLLAALREPGARRDLEALRRALREALPQRLANYLAEIGGPRGWTNAALEACEQGLHRWEFHPVGTEGFEKAEVTSGGVDTAGLQSRTMEARAVPGLFFIGEVVDVTGQLGGFNLQWAWSSGVAAGRAV
jgi:predicted flavoprotein YhiN